MRNISRDVNETPPKTTRREFVVNRRLDLSRIAAIGLDLDNTLAVYDAQKFNELALMETCVNLVRHRNYPAEIESIRYVNSDVARGLVLDLELGGLLKCDCRDQVLRACYDREWFLGKAVRTRYGDDPLDLTRLRFETIDSTFDLPAASLFGSLAKPSIKTDAAPVGYRSICVDIREMLDRTHVRGRLKKLVVASLGHMVASKPQLAGLLASYRAAGKKFFLLTNSDAEYTVELMDHVFPVAGTSSLWRTLFDIVVVHADKPGFFDGKGDPTIIEAGGHQASIIQGGGGAYLESSLGVGGDQILFIGDNPVADGAAARALRWRTALIVPELDHGRPPPDSPDQDTLLGGWGEALWDAGKPTRFARVVNESADVVTSRVENLLSVSPDNIFETG
jgi:HAD superfamily 5'-nucleotidase-like hydrolase